MKKFPLTKQGIRELHQELHQLNDTELLQEIIAMRRHFAGWLHTKFHLSPEQMLHIRRLSSSFLHFACTKFTSDLAHRRCIDFTIFAQKRGLRELRRILKKEKRIAS